MNTSTPIYNEVQRWRHVWWVVLLVVGLAALQWWIFIAQVVVGNPVGNNPASDALTVVTWLIFGVGFPLFFLWLHMVIEVTAEVVIIRFRPFANRRIALSEIDGVEARTYRPIREFGGWGVRGWGQRVAYNVSGNQSVELTLLSGRQVVIGTKRPEVLAAAILQARGGG